MAGAPHLQRGQAAERLAARYLLARGLRPVAANFRCRRGELDLVMTEGRVLVVVEVRFRLRTNVATPAETINPAKRRRIIRATENFLLRAPAHVGRPVRFDVVAITGEDSERTVRWLRGAFTADDVAGP